MKNIKKFIWSSFLITSLALSANVSAEPESLRQILDRQNAFRARMNSERLEREIRESIREQKRRDYEEERMLKEYEDRERSRYYLNEPSDYDYTND